MRMITNHLYSIKDKEALIKGSTTPTSHFDFSITNFSKIKDSLDEHGRHFFNCLAWLIAEGRIEIKVVKPKLSRGIAHYKSGVFDDGATKIKFDGSCNFTAYGLLENLENITIRKSFEGISDKYSIQEFESEFEEMISGNYDSFEYLDFKEIEEAIKNDFGDKNIQELLIEEKELLHKKQKLFSRKERLSRKLKQLEDSIDSLLTKPKFPYDAPREYQNQAYDEWTNYNYKGIFAMATGTGKTLTSLNCILNEFEKTGNYRGIILVPTIELVAQWKKEIQKFRFKNIILVSSKNKNWRNDLSRVASLSKNDSTYSFFIVSTYRTFTSPRFQTALRRLPKDVCIIADEAHNCGSPAVVQLLEECPVQRRIGLSATPERIYDTEGTDLVNQFFNSFPPYTFEFSMEEALKSDFLCKYYYYPILIELTPIELERYTDISLKLAKFFNSSDEEIKEAYKKLLLIRKQIIHKASNKIISFDSLIRDLSEDDKLKNTLVYAPEGYFNELFTETESLNHLDLDESRICDIYSSRIRSISPSTKVALFNGSTKDRSFILDKFADEELEVLVSMKCLDEGVDVPRTQTAIFCASTGNPRQFIQRRGRILRKHKKKDFAVIYDLVVVPSTSRIIGDEKVERKLVENELRRVQEFARLALNRHNALDKFSNIISLYNLNEMY